MAYTKEELIAALQAAVGDTEEGQKIIAKAEKVWGETGKYSQDLVDRLHEEIGVDRMWAKKDEANGKAELAAGDEAKIAIIDKALAAIDKLG